MADLTAQLVHSTAIPTFVGSALSFVASSTALVLHMTLPPKRHFRHALILNLLVADCLNSLNNTISGLAVLSAGHTLTARAPVTAACLVNAWVGQFSVQAVDFNILIISIVVLLTVFRTHLLSDASPRNATLLCVAAWIPGLITSNIAWALGAFGHVSGNWCWIRRDRLALRYALTHGWRIAIFLATVAIYTVIYLRLTRVFGILRVGNSWSTFPSKPARSCALDDPADPADPADHAGPDRLDLDGILVSQSFSVSHEPQTGVRPHHHHHHPHHAHLSRPTTELRPLPTAAVRAGPGPDSCPEHHFHPDTDPDLEPDLDAKTAIIQSHTAAAVALPPPAHDPAPRTTRASALSMAKVPAPPNVRRMLLMNGYPVAYILLWVPGIANRLVESINGSSPQWLTALQASTQFVGFVNAITYSYSEQMRQDLFQIWTGKQDFQRMRN
ncbi:hypothetical protein E4U42_006059 [Claviceps africana]|uniref:Glucose receptor Git3 N-terminal domain-containing protein n=1 Tax=Claviceps africana TaxID=83212 RepID=A0A8K0J8X4_9HYPO|nr:hypothetical protein E4U42_006059 [Claviceps africana]